MDMSYRETLVLSEEAMRHLPRCAIVIRNFDLAVAQQDEPDIALTVLEELGLAIEGTGSKVLLVGGDDLGPILATTSLRFVEYHGPDETSKKR